MVDKRKDRAVQDIRKSLTDEELAGIRLRREYEDTYIKNDFAKRCAVRTDQVYQQFDQLVSDVDGTLFNILNASQNLKNYQVQIVGGEVVEVYPGTDKVMTVRDLEIGSLILKSKIGDGLRGMWLMLAQLYKYVGNKRLDNVVFFSEEQYNKKVGFVVSELKKNGINLFQERV